MMRLILLLGDVLVIFLFALIGRQTHSLPADIGSVATTFLTAAPFILGWLLAAPWFGVYRPQSWGSLAGMARSVLLAFIPAFVIGVLIRAFLVGRFSPPIFYLVTAGVILAMLFAWRLLVILIVTIRIRS